MSVEDYTDYKGAVMLWKIIPPFLIVFGTTGNTITIIVLLQKRLRNSPTSIFLATLAMSDILALTTGLLRQWIKYTFDVDIREDLTVSGCKFHWFIVYVVTQFSSWMLICVTVERVISTFMPHKRRVFCKMRFASITVCAILCFLVSLNAHYLFGYGNLVRNVDNETELERCMPTTDSYAHFIIYSWTWIDLCVFYLIPMLVMIIGNSMIIYKVFDSQRRSRRTVAPTSNPSVTAQRRKTSSLTVLLMFVSALFIICITPIVVYPIGEPYWKEGAPEHKVATMFLVETMANLLMYVNHSVNFVVYFLSGSKFRSEVNRVVCCKNITVIRQQTTVSRSGI
ncbi:G-protein coupled receptor daf-37-like [Mercenaria mercenaria]|uniref:G-protein coupled receptor daf-37-like n=1 Tax=Mercenaria mercenaria TaxID=6596 RepID=UPI00234EADDC|nr:G-protein coupled receptor daf-37-like [Mercenaria mercenaria]